MSLNNSQNSYERSMTNTNSDNSSMVEYFTGLFSNKNAIIIILLIILFLSLVGINLLLLFGNAIADITAPIVPAMQSLLSMIGFTAGHMINGSADLVANTADIGIDIAKGTTRSIGDLLINSGSPGIDTSKQVSLTEVIGVQRLQNKIVYPPKPVESSNPTVTPISAQKLKAGWCHVGDFSGLRGCVEVKEHDKCMSGQIFTNQSKCLNPASS